MPKKLSAGGSEAMAKYHYLIVGAGLFGSVFAQQAAEKGKRCLVIDRRSHVAGIAHCDMLEDIQVYKYGPHIFHTEDREIWDYVNRFARFNNYIYSPMAMCSEGVFNLPFNMNTFARLWGTRTPAEAMEKIKGQIARENIGVPKNMEELCLKTAGRELYELFLKPFIEKSLGVPCSELPPSPDNIQPLRFVFDNRFYNTPFQGIPMEGYDVMIKRMLAGCEVMLGTEYLAFGRANPGIAEKTIYTGMIDEYFRFKRGMLEYRTSLYKTDVLDIPNYQGTAIMEHVDRDTPYIRTIEHKHFQFGNQPKTVVTKEYPAKWTAGMEPCYPVNNEANQKLFNAYKALAVTQLDVIFCGRLGSFHYYYMDETVRAALNLAKMIIK